MKVAIIGGLAKEKFFSASRGTEIWGLNAIRPEWVPRWDRMFNLHLFAGLEKDWPRGLKKERKWIRANPKIPFYTTDPWPEWATSQKLFPREELDKMPRGDYHCGSFDWMVAFAVHLGATSVAIHGVGLNLESGEPISARACLEYWCGYAEGRGVKITTAQDCDIFFQYHLVKCRHVYGYDEMPLVEDRTNKEAA